MGLRPLIAGMSQTSAGGGGGGNTVVNGVFITPKNALSGTEIDTSKALNTKSVSTATTFTFSGTPATTDTWFSLELTETSGTARTITIPSSISVARGAAITSFLLPASTTVLLQWHYDGTNYILLGDPASVNDLTADPTPDVAADYFLVWDTSASRHVKVLMNKVATLSSAGNVFQGINYFPDIRETGNTIRLSSNTLRLASNAYLGMNSSNVNTSGSIDTILWRNAAGIFACGTAAYNTSGAMVFAWDRTVPVTVSGLPAVGTAGKGARCFVTDANATTFGSVVAGGGSNNVPVYCDGTNWLIG